MKQHSSVGAPSTSRVAALIALGALLLCSCAKRPEHAIVVQEPRGFAYSDELLDAVGEIPIQHLGRVKPLSTAAAFSLLKINGKRRYEIPEESGLPTGGERLDPTGWLLDVLFFPEQAKHYEVFLVEESAVLEGVGLRFPDRKRRDRYSYAQLEPAREKIRAAAQAAHGKEQRFRSAVDQQSLDLHQRLFEYELLSGTLDFARLPVPEEVPPPLAAALGEALDAERHTMSATALVTRRAELEPFLARTAEVDAGVLDAFWAQIQRGFEMVGRTTHDTLAFVAPEVPSGKGEGAREEWDTPGRVLEGAASGGEPRGNQIALLDELAGALRERRDPARFEARLTAARDGAVALAEARGEFRKIQMERSFYRIDFFYRALAVFVLAFLLAAFSWIGPGARVLGRSSVALTVVGFVLVTAGITMRCILRERPPVVSLYDTILFITGVAVLITLVIGWAVRLPLAPTVGAMLGAAGMFMANRYELREAASSGDTMATVQAVLDTNFWLATHVTTVTIGYAAGLLACVLGHVWLGAWMWRRGGADPQRLRLLGRVVYGTVAFGLLFSVVGTILGGIWANDSWGRFWGWDPKENGALMICLFEIAIVHARLGGYIKDFGVAVSAIVLGPVVAFSWWHVNLLGVGLHSYGFTAGIKEKLFAYYYTELAVVTVALVWWALSRPSHLAQRSVDAVPQRGETPG